MVQWAKSFPCKSEGAEHLYNSWALVEVPLLQSLSNGERELLGQAVLRDWLISKLWVQVRESTSDE